MNDLDRLSALDPMRDFEPTPERRARATAALDEMVREPAAPRPSATRRLVFSGAALVAAATVAVAAVQLVPSEDGNRAYAWTAAPQAVADADALRQARQCAAGWGPDWTTTPAAADIMLSERRGTATMLLVRDRTRLTSCFVLDPAQGVAGADLLDTSSAAPAAGRVVTESMFASEGSQGWYSSLIGRAGAGVEKVQIELPDGTKVRASLKSGWWTAWWPGAEGGQADGVRIVVYTGEGTRTFKPSEL
jgi:hypothetical protein